MKRLSQRERVKRHLLAHGSITNVEAVNMKILRLSERIRELQELGLEIAGDWVREGGRKTATYRYELTRRPPRMRMEVVMVDGRPVARPIVEHS